MGSPHANKKTKSYPDGTTFSDWYIEPGSDGTPYIRRYFKLPGGSKRQAERYPRGKYKHLLNDPNELGKFLIRLNGDDPDKRRAKEVFEVRNAYISQEVLQHYYDSVLCLAIKSEKDRKTA